MDKQGKWHLLSTYSAPGIYAYFVYHEAMYIVLFTSL